jgi:hypothetical protein
MRIYGSVVNILERRNGRSDKLVVLKLTYRIAF